MKNKIIMLGILIATFILLSGISFAATCTNEIVNSSIIGVIDVNVTVSGVIDGDYNASNPVLYGRCTDTTNSTYTVIVNTTNSEMWVNGTAGTGGSGEGIELNLTYDSAGLEDSKLCDFYVVVSNRSLGTNEVTCSASTGNTIDNTAPTLPSITSPVDESIDTDGSVTFTVGVTGSRTTGCTINIENAAIAMTHTGDTCTYTDATMSDGNYGWTVSASDGLNTSTTSAQTLFIDKPGGSTAGAMKAINRKKSTTIEGFSINAETKEKTKAMFKEEMTKKELTKTGIGVGTGAALGLLGGPFAIVTVPVGAAVGGIIGFFI